MAIHRKTAIVYRRGILCFAGIVFGCMTAFCQPHADSLRNLIADLRTGALLYNTPEAIDYFAKLGTSNAQAVSIQQDVTLKSLRAALTLAEMGKQAEAAVPVLVDRFVACEHVIEQKGLQYTKGRGTFEDWEQTYIANARNDFIMSSYVIEYETLSKCDQWIEAVPVIRMTNQRLGAQGILLSATVDLSIIIRIDAAAYALNAITGADAGLTRSDWQRWMVSNGAHYEKALVNLEKPRAFNVGATYSVHLVSGDTIIGVVMSYIDSTLELRTSSGKPYMFRSSLIDTVTMLAAATDVLPKAAPDSAGTAKKLIQVGFQELTSKVLIGEEVNLDLLNGTVVNGTLVSAKADVVTMTVHGTEKTIARNTVVRVFLVQK